MREQRPDFDSRNWGDAKLSDLVGEIGLFEIEPRPAADGVSVRLAQMVKWPRHNRFDPCPGIAR
ncbi:OST-HTH/LOTUS domain-containing protein [Microbacterium sp. NPDC019599]|uniref:OST-HTH/LOTUS domain-containing protein n=1 Tax=Microbacterium sp. NPDC019599 TaxID=3154690 RepID=UPI0033D914A6